MVDKRVVFFAVIYLILSVNLASASFLTGNLSDSITLSYAPGDTISGWVNVSFSNEASNSILKCSSGEEISLIGLLKKPSNSAFTYTCSPVSCISNYQASNKNTAKTLNMNENSSVLVGINLSGPISTGLTLFRLNISTNSTETDKLPLTIDILNDGQIEWQAYVPSVNFMASGENFGCFESNLVTSQTNLASIPQYCEKVHLTKSPQVEIGSYVTGSGNVDFNMKIQRIDDGTYATCPASVTATGLQRAACIPTDFSILKDGDYYVCIKTQNAADNNKYKINYETNQPCGFTGTYNGIYDFDFEIFAKEKMYAGGINFTLNDAELVNSRSALASRNIEQYINNYILTTYNNDCSKGCIIPIKIFSGLNQQINITDVLVQYVSNLADETRNIYDIQETPSLISSGFQKLYLGEVGCHAPNNYGNSTFSINLNNNTLLSEQISIGEVAMIESLTPTTTAIKYPTTFTVVVGSSKNITKYDWDFGNGDMQTTTKNSVTYTYNAIGNYSLKITLTDAFNKTSFKNFNITVGPASTIVPTLLTQAETSITTIRNQLTSFTLFEQKAINSSLNLDAISKNITRLRNASLAATTDSQFQAILGELINLKIPNTISRTASGSGIIFYPQGNNIDINVLSEISGGTYDSGNENSYKSAVLAWDETNTNTVLVYSEISSVYQDNQKPLVKTFDITITKSSADDAYLIIKNMDGLSFKQDYSQKKQGDYYYITLSQAQQEVAFSTTEDVNFVNLPIFISPSLSSLVPETPISPFTVGGGLRKWVVFVIIFIVICVIALILWMLLQHWYKKKYESTLFKNRNNLYNLVNYIESSKEKGMNEREIIDKLRKAGWTSEQLRYAMRKHAGKNTGMPEIKLKLKKFDRNKNPQKK